MLDYYRQNRYYCQSVIGNGRTFRKFGVLRYIDLVIAPAEEGVAKPDLKIFEIALNRANCMPQNAMMVGDRFDNDIAPANRLGMKSALIKQGFHQLSTPGSELEKPDYVISNLQEFCSRNCSDI